MKIADVGLAKAEIDITSTFRGIPVYRAPEVFHSQRYDSKADIYSLGLLMWEMWYGHRAFADAPGTTLHDFFDWVDEGNRPVHKPGFKTLPPWWEQLMPQCWDSNPDKRPTAMECIVTKEWQRETGVWSLNGQSNKLVNLLEPLQRNSRSVIGRILKFIRRGIILSHKNSIKMRSCSWR